MTIFDQSRCRIKRLFFLSVTCVYALFTFYLSIVSNNFRLNEYFVNKNKNSSEKFVSHTHTHIHSCWIIVKRKIGGVRSSHFRLQILYARKSSSVRSAMMNVSTFIRQFHISLWCVNGIVDSIEWLKWKIRQKQRWQQTNNNKKKKNALI